jgi:hypothetical protein
MSDIITDYQKWKRQGEDLRVQAKQAMEGRFRELLSEAVQIAHEYRADFGAILKPPAPITAFRYKASAKSKAKKMTTKQKPVLKNDRGTAAAMPAAAKPNPKVTGLQKRLSTAKKKLDAAKGAGKPTQLFEDRIYEIEDELRLASASQ